MTHVHAVKQQFKETRGSHWPQCSNQQSKTLDITANTSSRYCAHTNLVFPLKIHMLIKHIVNKMFVWACGHVDVSYKDLFLFEDDEGLRKLRKWDVNELLPWNQNSTPAINIHFSESLNELIWTSINTLRCHNNQYLRCGYAEKHKREA